MIFLLACLSTPILSTKTWNRGADVRIIESADVPDFSQPGTYGFRKNTGKKRVHETCMMDYTLYETEKQESVLVIVSHGFARNRGHMKGWAEHLASWGFTVLTPKHCHLHPRDVNPKLAAAELLVLSKELDFARVIYAGQSNGGAISIIAGAQDPKAIAVVGLDTTESYTNPTSSYAKRISIPVYGLLGEASPCNAHGNGRQLYGEISKLYTYKINTADHCDFEYPSGGFCYVFCSLPHTEISRKELRGNIVSLVTAAMLVEAEQNVWATLWWAQRE